MPPVGAVGTDEGFAKDAKRYRLDLDARGALAREVSRHVNNQSVASGQATVAYNNVGYTVTYKYDAAKQKLTCTGIKP